MVLLLRGVSSLTVRTGLIKFEMSGYVYKLLELYTNTIQEEPFLHVHITKRNIIYFRGVCYL